MLPNFKDYLIFKLDSYVHLDLARPILLTELYDLKLPVSCMTFLPKHKILLLGFQKRNLKAKIENIFSVFNIREKSKSNSVSGGIGCYKQLNERLDYKKLWRQPLPYGVNCMCYDEDLSILAVGMVNGNILCYGVWPEKGFNEFDQYCVIRNHKKCVNGVGLCKTNGCVYSIGQDIQLIVTNINDNEKLYHKPTLCNFEPVKLLMDEKNKRFFIGDTGGNILIYRTKIPIQAIHIIQVKPSSKITCLYIDPNSLFFFGCTKLGLISIYNLKPYKREKTMLEISYIQTKEDISSISYNSVTKELFAASNTCGSVQIINSTKGKVFTVIPSHKDNINEIYLMQKDRLLFTISNDENLKIWKLPLNWKKNNDNDIKKINFRKQQPEYQRKGKYKIRSRNQGNDSDSDCSLLSSSSEGVLDHSN